MKSKSKKSGERKESTVGLVLVSILVALIALLQNYKGQFTDVLQFYALHFWDGLHHWPYSEHTLLGTTETVHPVEYPALTGLIMWLISFAIDRPEPFSLGDAFEYYRITAAFHVALLVASAYLIKKLSAKKFAYYFVLAPAVLYSLNRNWDIWAIASMLLAILWFEKKHYQISAVMLAISIAAKFFPIVLMLPITIIFLRNKQSLILFKYGSTVAISWISINLPFAIIDLKGWAYFYEFSFERGLGTASFYQITQLIFSSTTFTSIHFYLLNVLALFGVLVYLLKLKLPLSLAESAFFVMFAFMLFNKQYSMQYIIWLTCLAVLALSNTSRRHREYLVYIYVLWQVVEFAFQYAFFQNLLTNSRTNTDLPMTIQISNTTYAYIGVARYLIAIIFALFLAKSLKSTKTRFPN